MKLAALAVLVGCSTPAAPVPATAPLAAKSYFRVDAARPLPLACQVGAACELELVITALDGFHVNAEYPTKFVREGATSRFTAHGEARGTLTVTVTPAAGTDKVVGVVKLSVCSGERCEIEAPEVTIPLAASNG